MTQLPILMYHNVSPTVSEGLTISVDKLDKQFAYLSAQGYSSSFLRDLMDIPVPKIRKRIVITFDDAYVSQMELVLPLLKTYNLKATFFVPLNYLGKTDQWHSNSVPVMTAEQLKSLDPDYIELGYHSFYHKKYDEMSEAEILDDLQYSFDAVKENGLTLSPVIAYPYGKFPRKGEAKELFFEILKQQGFRFGLRIGNRINLFPFVKPFEIQRLDIKGEYSLSRFKRKLRFGKIF